VFDLGSIKVRHLVVAKRSFNLLEDHIAVKTSIQRKSD
jgi:hypothetical protein